MGNEKGGGRAVDAKMLVKDDQSALATLRISRCRTR